jgi:VanZ family protein
MTRIALAYAALFAVAVVAADAGWLPRFAEWLHDLPFADKAVHFVMFGTLALMANLALASRGNRSLLRAIVIGSIIVLIVATAEEYSNRYLIMRDWSLGDLAANYLGVACLGMLPLWQRQLVPRDAAVAADDSPGPRDAGSR